MNNNTIALLEARFKELYTDRLIRLTEPWEPSVWSKSYRAEFATRDTLYIKGTPRSRPESYTTLILSRYCPHHIPAVLNEDVLPEHPWRWFLLEDAGECNHENLTPVCAVSAAFHLGKVQSNVCHDAWLTSHLPQCQADRLQEAISGVCEWALPSVAPDIRDDFLCLQATITQATNYFRTLQKRLAHVPSTCVHGDFWSGNIAFNGDKISFIDWGDALWGVGSISIANLLASAGETLSSHAHEIWEAYARGREIELTEDFIRGSEIAAMVGSLVVDVEIAKCCNGKAEMLLGLLPTLHMLAQVVT